MLFRSSSHRHSLTLDNFPFQVNDEIMVENTSVGVGSTGTGYNSSDYSYSFFRVVEIDPNIGGVNGITQV